MVVFNPLVSKHWTRYTNCLGASLSSTFVDRHRDDNKGEQNLGKNYYLIF